METWYNKEEDILNIELDNTEYWKSIELGNGVVLDISKDGKITAIEIMETSKLLKNDRAKVLQHAKITV